MGSRNTFQGPHRRGLAFVVPAVNFAAPRHRLLSTASADIQQRVAHTWLRVTLFPGDSRTDLLISNCGSACQHAVGSQSDQSSTRALSQMARTRTRTRAHTPQCTRQQVSPFMDLLGSPWAPAKHQPFASAGDFLGLAHDLSAASLGLISYWPRKSLIDKTHTLISKFRMSNRITSGEASKPAGLVAFLETGCFGRIL